MSALLRIPCTTHLGGTGRVDRRRAPIHLPDSGPGALRDPSAAAGLGSPFPGDEVLELPKHALLAATVGVLGLALPALDVLVRLPLPLPA